MITKFIFSNIFSIKSRQRQLTPIREFEIRKHLNNLDGVYTFRELERILIKIWITEITQCYNITTLGTDMQIDEMVDCFCKLRQLFGTSMLAMVKAMFWDLKPLFNRLGKSFEPLSREDRVMIFLPLLTTMDTFQLNLCFKNSKDNVASYFEKIPVEYVPMISDGKFVICTLKNNLKDNPTNSVFGPSGVVCPGSSITTQIIRAMRPALKDLNYEVIGTPIQEKGRIISGISNKESLSFRFQKQENAPIETVN